MPHTTLNLLALLLATAALLVASLAAVALGHPHLAAPLLVLAIFATLGLLVLLFAPNPVNPNE